MKKNKARPEGFPLRRQYFSAFLWYAIALLAKATTWITAADFRMADPGEGGEVLAQLPVRLAIIGMFLLPLAVLCVLNIFFGTVVCKAGKKGLEYNGKWMKWEEIESVTYDPSVVGRYRLFASSATVKHAASSGTVDTVIEHFPFHGLWAVRKYAPHARIKMSGSFWVLVALWAVMAVLAPALDILLAALFG